MKIKPVGAGEKAQMKYYVILDTGDEIISSLKKFAVENRISGASISGIGTLRNPELGFFDIGKREYLKKTIKGDFELLSLDGNISVSQDGTVVHTHVLISDEKFNAFGGHLFSGEITGTGEIIIETCGEKIERKYNKQANLNLIKI
jgi:uncharacterized protein